MVAAIGKNRELGKDNGLLWHLKADMKHFKDLTEGHVVIMGRKTYESLPEKFRPLPNRINVVVSRKSNESNETNKSNLTYWVNSIEDAIKIINNKSQISNKFQISNFKLDQAFIIGGASIYEQGIKYADKLYLTLVDKEYPDADAFFPEYGEFKVEVETGHGEEGDLKYRFVEIVKK